MRGLPLSLFVISLAVAWLGPLPRWAEHSFAAHMSLHMLVVALAAPLLAVCLAGSRFDPVVYQPQLFPAVIASVFELLVVWLWHTPALHHFARQSTSGFVIEQSFFLLSGAWLWLAAFGGPEDKGKASASKAQMVNQRRAAGVLALLLTSMHMTLLGALLLLSPRLLFAAHSHGMASSSPLNDQQLGGCIMLVGGGVAYLVGGLVLVSKLLGTRHAERTRSS